MRRLFNDFEKKEVLRALGAAEELASAFYCIPGREWPRYPYEVRTRAEDPGPGGEAFADVVLARAVEIGSIELINGTVRRGDPKKR